jgi:WD40 repeat protein
MEKDLFSAAAAISPHGQQALTGSHDKTARLWDLASH